MLRDWLKAVAVLLIFLTIGLAGGLLYGLVIDPVQYAVIGVEDLAQRYKNDYLRLIAADYAQTRDLPVAQQRLQRIGFDAAIVQQQAETAVFEGQAGAGALARLATDLGVGTERMAVALISPTPTNTPTPTMTNTPLPTETATRTPRPSPSPSATPERSATPEESAVPEATEEVEREATATLASAATRAPTRAAQATQAIQPTQPPAPTQPPLPTQPPAPTRTPLPPTQPPAPSVDFVLVRSRLLSVDENGGCAGLHNAFVTVVDAAGTPLNGVTVEMRWDAGSEQKLTGHKQFAGRAEFDLYGGYHITVVGVDGRAAVTQGSAFVTSHYPADADLIAGGYCADQSDCDRRKAEAPPQLCYGHYSWEVLFRRTY